MFCACFMSNWRHTQSLHNSIIWCISPLFSVMVVGKSAGLPLVRSDNSSTDVPFLIKASLFFLINSESNGNYIEERRLQLYEIPFCWAENKWKITFHRNHLHYTIIHQVIKHFFEDKSLRLLICIKPSSLALRKAEKISHGNFYSSLSLKKRTNSEFY